MKSIFILLLSFSYFFNINAQSDFLVWETELIRDRNDNILKVDSRNDFGQFYIILQKGDFQNLEWSYNGTSHWKPVHQNEHNDKIQISELYFVPKGTKTLYLRNVSTLEGKIYFQKIKPLELKNRMTGSRSTDCILPSIVTQAEWRVGLPDPVPGRAGSKVNHLIIHHSAGDNGRDNYVDVVRAYYLFHINGNGWDDIGYNYLVDPYGVLYAGRDPLDSGIDQDNVIGAHLCGKNTNTMGVCVIGDFTDTFPSILARATLINLLSWKAIKDSIEIFGAAIHPSGSGTLLDRIAGHRDGCSTSCPGERFYPLLHEIKVEIQAKVDNCLLSTGVRPDISKKSDWQVSPNPFTDIIKISLKGFQSNAQYRLRDNHGHFVLGGELPPSVGTWYELDLSQYPAGIYYLQILSPTSATVKKIIKH